jgi:hypothetical protein
MYPRIIEAKSRGGFLGDEYVGYFDNRVKRITRLTGVLLVGVVNAPELLARLRSRTRFHGGSSSRIERAKMYVIHKMRGQSGRCPVRRFRCSHEDLLKQGLWL